MSDKKNLKTIDSEVYDILKAEDKRQEDNLIMIASENYVSRGVLEASSSTLTNKYAEGYPGKRYYNGCQHADQVEALAIERIRKLFNAQAANVQPHSGAQANMAVMMSLLDAGDTYIGMNLSHGGHLSHGSPVNFSGKYFNVVAYGVREDNNLIDYDALAKLAKEHKPKLIIAGASAYPRLIDFVKFKEIADSVGAKLMADIAHIAGLVAAGEHPTPVNIADFVTMTTHKTLRGPRGGVILGNAEYEASINKFMFPGTQGGPLMHTIASKAVSFKEALQPEFKTYQQQIVKNAKALAEVLLSGGFKLVSGGTDNHLILIDLRNKNVTGKDAANRLDEAGITCNKNGVPFDDKSPFVTSGIRLGSPALTTRGLKEDDFRRIGKLITMVIDNMADDSVLAKVKGEVAEICKAYPTDFLRI
ncbi:MAG TPA: serine hydroxymethyltransferase [Spirochaetota bacterium]|nr:serine hydroxymethyltransferase [Spirochaetota bacterium]HPF05293.1 serine hydroxymethyltransferase [Spirochaetota bacterium]HPJ41031.1 serine hydroxymethyltransferase [Spirochaetota bacterium]HPR36317.1 serine hydroxymethyltransferase [Spirochaetota bacterium]HRX46744.1 serine hydroxymethyltransferase [Spirochaetota bacterium]